MENLDQVGDLLIGPATALFLLLSAPAHFSLATFDYNFYVRNLKMHINRARWHEYAVSSSLMIVIIAMLNGMYDVPSPIVIFSLNAMMILFGYMIELHAHRVGRWKDYLFGERMYIVLSLVAKSLLAWQIFFRHVATELGLFLRSSEVDHAFPRCVWSKP